MTVEESFKKFSAPYPRYGRYLCGDDEKRFKECLIEFAEYYVKEALEAAKTVGDDFEGNELMSEAILESYPLNKII